MTNLHPNPPSKIRREEEGKEEDVISHFHHQQNQNTIPQSRQIISPPILSLNHNTTINPLMEQVSQRPRHGNEKLQLDPTGTKQKSSIKCTRALVPAAAAAAKEDHSRRQPKDDDDDDEYMRIESKEHQQQQVQTPPPRFVSSYNINSTTTTTIPSHEKGTTHQEEEINSRERLKKHRCDMAGRVWIPDIWGQEDLLKDWTDCSVFDSELASERLMSSARAALATTGGGGRRRAN